MIQLDLQNSRRFLYDAISKVKKLANDDKRMDYEERLTILRHEMEDAIFNVYEKMSRTEEYIKSR